jgi:CheY-like chemotaxis protein
MLAAFLAEMGYEAFAAGDAARALSLAQDVVPDAAILDIGLPDVDGYELALAIRHALGERAPRLIALTGYAQGSDRDRAIACGFVEHLAKPVDMSEHAPCSAFRRPAGGRLEMS